jgi:hemerythrin-like metal-binding protein
MKHTACARETALDVPSMDRSHHILFGDLSELAALPEYEFRAHFDTMVVDLERDFYAEDEWMERIDYPETQFHREQHAIVLSALHHTHSKVKTGDIEFGRLIVASLSTWLAQHIAMTDLPLARAIRRVGLR